MPSPPGTLIGRLRVKVLPDTSDFPEDAKKQLEKIKKQIGDITVEITFDLDDADLARIKRKLSSALPDLSVGTEVDDQFDLEALRRRFHDAGFTVPAEADVTVDEKQVARARRKIEKGLEGIEAPVEIERSTLPLLGQIVGLVQEIERGFAGAGRGLVSAAARGSLLFGVIASIAALVPVIMGAITVLPGILGAAGIAGAALLVGADGIAAAFEGLSSTIREIPEVVSVQTQAAFTPLVDAINSIDEDLASGLSQVALSFRDINGAIGDVLTRSGESGQLDRIFDGVSDVVEALAPLVETLAAAFLDMVEASLPFLPGLIDEVAAAFEEALPQVGAMASETGQLQANVDALTQFLVALIEILPILTLVLTGVSLMVGTNVLVIGQLIDAVIGMVKPIINSFRTIGSGVRLLETDFVGGIVRIIQGLFDLQGTIALVPVRIAIALGEAVATLAEKAAEAVGITGGLPSRIRASLGDPDTLLRDIGFRIIEGLANGVRAAFDALMAPLLESITRAIPDLKGPPHRDRHLLDNAADDIIGGFTDRIEANFGQVRSVFSAVPIDIDGITPAGAAVQQTFVVDPASERGFVEDTARAAQAGADRAILLRLGLTV